MNNNIKSLKTTQIESLFIPFITNSIEKYIILEDNNEY